MASPNIRANQIANPQNPSTSRSIRPSHTPPPPRPLPAGVVDHGYRYPIAQRVHCLALIAEGFSHQDITRKTGVSQSSQSRIKKRAFKRGFRPEINPRILDSYVEDRPRTGRPKEITIKTEEALLKEVRADRAGREKSSEVLAYNQNISVSSALQILKKHGLTCVKPTRKPGLNLQQKKARLKFCLKHKDWTVKDWKRVI